MSPMLQKIPPPLCRAVQGDAGGPGARGDLAGGQVHQGQVRGPRRGHRGRSGEELLWYFFGTIVH